MRKYFPNKNPSLKIDEPVDFPNLTFSKKRYLPTIFFLARHHLDNLDIKKTFLETKHTVLNNACRQLHVTLLHYTHTTEVRLIQNYFKSLKTL